MQTLHRGEMQKERFLKRAKQSKAKNYELKNKNEP
jgi:hypothetical protein